MRTFQKNLRAQTQVGFNGAGVATATIPHRLGPSWEIKQISIKTTSTAITAASTYRGINASGEFISSTAFNGNSRTDSNPNVTLKTGDSIACVWTGGSALDINGQATQATLLIIYDEVGY